MQPPCSSVFICGYLLYRRAISCDHRPALLPSELGHVVWPAPALPARARPLPSGERLRTGPGAGRGAGALVGVADAGLDLVEEPLHLRGIPREDPRREAILRGVGLGERRVEAVHLADR